MLLRYLLMFEFIAMITFRNKRDFAFPGSVFYLTINTKFYPFPLRQKPSLCNILSKFPGDHPILRRESKINSKISAGK